MTELKITETFKKTLNEFMKKKGYSYNDDVYMPEWKEIYIMLYNAARDIGEKELVHIDGQGWQRCCNGHTEILYREKFCPMCVVKVSMLHCYEEIFWKEVK